jgi:hypothetical protein
VAARAARGDVRRKKRDAEGQVVRMKKRRRLEAQYEDVPIDLSVRRPDPA